MVIFSPTIPILSLKKKHRGHKQLTNFVLYLLPQLLWSALTKFDGGGEENGVKVRYQMELYVYILFNY